MPEGILKVVETIKRADRGLAIQEITEKGGLNRRTTEKAVELILKIQERLRNCEFKLSEVGRTKIVVAEPRFGRFSDLPEDFQKLVIKTLWFPRPSLEQETIAHLYLRGATKEEKAVPVNPEDSIVSKLVKQGQIKLRGKKACLTREGVIVAKGTLNLYPELIKLVETFTSHRE